MPLASTDEAPSHLARAQSAQAHESFWPAIAALGAGGFAIGTGEFVMMGLLPEVAADMKVSIPQSAHVISAYAVGVGVGAPVLAVLAACWPRRALLIALMTMFCLGNIATALASGYVSMTTLRFITGLPHATYFGVAALVAASLAPSSRRASAIGLVMSGLTSATLVGVPIATWLGQHLGWRAAYAIVALLAAVTCVLLRRCVPDIPPSHEARPRHELKALVKPQVMLAFCIGAIGFGGMFAVFSYIKPILHEVTGLSLATVPLILALFGMGMVIGNLVGARLADKSVTCTIAGLLLWNALVLASVPLTAPYPLAISINVFLLGTLVAIAPALQVRLMNVAGNAQTLAAALNHSAFNFANALGAWLGGWAIASGYGWTSTGWVGLSLAAAGMAVFMVSLWEAQRRLDR